MVDCDVCEVYVEDYVVIFGKVLEIVVFFDLMNSVGLIWDFDVLLLCWIVNYIGLYDVLLVCWIECEDFVFC